MWQFPKQCSRSLAFVLSRAHSDPEASLGKCGVGKKGGWGLTFDAEADICDESIKLLDRGGLKYNAS